MLVGEGGWRLRPHEAQMIDATVAILDEAAANTVRAQLAQDHFIERTDPRINVLPFYDLRSVPALPGPAFGDALYKVRMSVGGKTETGRVTFYEGRIRSVETRQPGKAYLGAQVSVISVVPGKPSETLTRSIDRSEHGRAPD